MELFVVRHAHAGQPDFQRWPDDALRPLTGPGAEAFRLLARALRTLADPPQVVLVSPLVRARETAAILQSEAGWPAPAESEALQPGRPPLAIVAALQPHLGASAVALVGHEPALHELLSYLLVGDERLAQIELEPGAVACLAWPGRLGPGGAVLRWLLSPAVARACQGTRRPRRAGGAGRPL